MIRRAWVLSVVVLLSLTVGTSRASFRLFDDFEDEDIAPVGGQDGWVSSGGDNQIVIDPADPMNQVLLVPSASSTLRKSLLNEEIVIPDGTVRMMFMRLRVSNKQTFSVGVSALSSPAEFSDFAPEIGMANSSRNLDLRVWDDDEGNYEVLTQLESSKWYNMWVLIDTVNNHYQIWLNDVPGASAAPSDQLAASDGDQTFDFRSGTQSSLRTFYIKTAGGSSGTNFGPVYFDAIYLENSSAVSLWNPTACGHPLDIDADCDVDRDDLAAFEDCALGPAIPQTDPECGWARLDGDDDIDQVDFGIFQRCYSGPNVPADPNCAN
ncbi:MAG TPA: hypothetical protein PKY77_22205 [Phycisphaerae bacterium]|nr:hypothetical protein [Phycisphaerae bacterium]HRY71256.1 hypothetical protein [Phycisphaerae bacterium]HSA29664.1 hypothetical protein [Phycisphaerae bacterium]